MCNFANVFVPGARVAFAPFEARGLHLSLAGTVQRDFAAHFAEEPGVLVCATGKQCLCGFDDWPALYGVTRDLRDAHHAPWAALLFFWASDRYTFEAERVVDEDDAPALHAGHLVTLRAEAPGRRAWRLLLDALDRSVGAEVVVVFHDGRERTGWLEAFDRASLAGMLIDSTGEAAPLIAAQVRSVVPRP